MKSLVWVLINSVQATFLAVWSTLWIVLALVVGWLTGGARLPLVMARRFWAPALMLVGGLRVEIEGLDNVDVSRPHFFAANHQSMADIPVVFYALPVPLVFILKKELRRVPLLGWYVVATRMILIDRQDRKKALASMSQCAERLAEGFSILIFPEGTRSRDGRLRRFKSGAFLPAIEAGVSIVPLAIHGTRQVLPSDGFRARPGVVHLAVGRPIATDELTVEDRRDLAEQVQSQVELLFQSCEDRAAATKAGR